MEWEVPRWTACEQQQGASPGYRTWDAHVQGGSDSESHGAPSVPSLGQMGGGVSGVSCTRALSPPLPPPWRLGLQFGRRLFPGRPSVDLELGVRQLSGLHLPRQTPAPRCQSKACHEAAMSRGSPGPRGSCRVLDPISRGRVAQDHRAAAGCCCLGTGVVTCTFQKRTAKRQGWEPPGW